MEWYVGRRGINQWPEVDATVQSAEQHTRYRAYCKLAFTYTDRQGDNHAVLTSVSNQTSLYNVGLGDTFPVRYNPAKPSHWFSSESGLLPSGGEKVIVGSVLLLAAYAVIIALNKLLF